MLVKGDKKWVLGGKEQNKRWERNSTWTFRYHQSSLSVKTQKLQFETNPSSEGKAILTELRLLQEQVPSETIPCNFPFTTRK